MRNRPRYSRDSRVKTCSRSAKVIRAVARAFDPGNGAWKTSSKRFQQSSLCVYLMLPVPDISLSNNEGRDTTKVLTHF